MPSPFPANATLIFKVPTGEQIINELGNPETQYEELVVQAYLSQQRDLSAPGGGTDTSKVRFKGRWIEPERPPAGLLPGAAAQATIGALSGVFTLEASAGSAFTAVDAALGFPLKGTLNIAVVWGDVC